MSGVAELLAGATEAAPVQRVRNYHLADREAVPRAQGFLTAMKRTDGALCVRWPGPSGVSASEASGGSSERSSDGGSPAAETVHVRRRADLHGDSALGRTDADAVAAVLPAGADRLVYWLPLELAEESVLAPTAESDRVFVAEVVSERETDHAHYVRQGRRGGWIPKGEARVYELAGRALGEGVEGRRESA